VNRCGSPIILVLLLGASSLSLRGQEPSFGTPREPEADLLCKLGGETDSDQGRLAEAKLYWRPTLDSQLSAGYTYSTLATTSAVQTSTRIVSLAGEYCFGTLGIGGGYDHVAESDLLASNTFTLRPFFESGAWRVELSGSRRMTDFERFGFVHVPFQGPNGVVLFASGSAQLNVASTGYGGTLDYAGEVWHAYAAYDAYSYGDFSGETTVTNIRNAYGRVSPEVFRALAGNLVYRLQRFAGSNATRKASLLDNSTTVGMDVALHPFRIGVEGIRDKDHLTQYVSDTLTGILSLDATRRMTLDLRGGATKSDRLGTIRFVGLSLVLRTIPKAKFS